MEEQLKRAEAGLDQALEALADTGDAPKPSSWDESLRLLIDGVQKSLDEVQLLIRLWGEGATYRGW